MTNSCMPFSGPPGPLLQHGSTRQLIQGEKKIHWVWWWVDRLEIRVNNSLCFFSNVCLSRINCLPILQWEKAFDTLIIVVRANTLTTKACMLLQQCNGSQVSTIGSQCERPIADLLGQWSSHFYCYIKILMCQNKNDFEIFSSQNLTKFYEK